AAVPARRRSGRCLHGDTARPTPRVEGAVGPLQPVGMTLRYHRHRITHRAERGRPPGRRHAAPLRRRHPMAESKSGEEFVPHEYDEAIAVHRGIVKAETALAKSHPHAESRAAIADQLKEDKGLLAELERLGKTRGATGKVEDVAEGITELLSSLVDKAGEAPSEAYEAH